MKEKLIIPEKISLEKESAPGIRRKDLKKLIAIAAPGTAIGIIMWTAFTERPLVQLVSMISIIIYLFLCYVIVARIDGSLSILDYLGLLIRFRREQQRFYYKQGKEKLFHVTAEGSPKNISAGIH